MSQSESRITNTHYLTVYSKGQLETINKAAFLRSQCQFDDAKKAFQDLFDALDKTQTNMDAHYMQTWLQYQIAKTLHQQGEFLQSIELVSTALKQLEESEFQVPDPKSDHEVLNYVYFKLFMLKAYGLRKVRHYSQCLEVCETIIEIVKEQSQIDDATPLAYWKYALRASYTKTVMLATFFEFQAGRELLTKFAQPLAKKLIMHFYKDTIVEDESKMLPDNTYAFEYRRVYAKFRKLYSFLGDAESQTRSLLYDQLKFYKLYDFTTFQEENPTIEEVKTDDKPKKNEDESKQQQDDQEPLIQKVEEVKEPQVVEIKEENRDEQSKVEVVAPKVDTAVADHSTFQPQLDKIDLSGVASHQESLHLSAGNQSIIAVCKTLMTLAKALVTRMKLSEAFAIYDYVESIYKKINGSDQLLINYKIKSEQSISRLSQTNCLGRSKYDVYDRPMQNAQEALKIATTILGERANNYIISKIKAQIGQIHHIKKEQEKSEEICLQAQSGIESVYQSNHPMMIKFNSCLIEAYNGRPETDEKTKLLQDIADRNYEIAVESFGQDSLFTIKSLFTQFTAYIAVDNKKTDAQLAQLQKLTLGKERIQANQFQFKSLIVIAMTNMLTQNPSVYKQIESTLSIVLSKQIQYVEGNKYHPFLEEVILQFANYFESMQSFNNAYIMWSHFLKIQQQAFGDDREQMITTYKKMATQKLCAGDTKMANEYFQIALNLMENYQSLSAVEQDADNKNDLKLELSAEEKEILEECAGIYFEQYLTATSSGNHEEALKYISKHNEMTIKINGSDLSSKCASNYFLIGQFQMRTGQLNSALVSVKKALEIRAQTAEDFTVDVNMVEAKFTLLQANTNFMLKRYKDAIASAELGLLALSKVKDQDANVLKAIMTTTKDLKNLMLRSRAKIEGVNALDLRRKLNGVEQTKVDDKLDMEDDDTVSKKTSVTASAVPKPTNTEPSRDDQTINSENVQGDDDKLQRALMVFGVTSLSSFALTYMALNKSN